MKMLAKQFPNRRAAMGEIVRLKTEMLLPKGTEYFFSDVHGEDRAFIHLLRSASGNIRRKIRDVYRTRLSESDQNEIAEIIYYPELNLQKKIERLDDERWVRKIILELIEVARFIASKYPREQIRAKMPEEYKLYCKKHQIKYVEHTDFTEEIIADADILYMTRVQRERFTDLMEYERVKNVYILRNKMLENTRPNLRILHPLPRVNEIAYDVDNNPKAYYFQQAQNGLYAREAILCDVLGITLEDVKNDILL